MEFAGPEASDLNDVRALNTAFLEILSGPGGERLRQELPPSLRRVVAAMTDRQITRLSAVPFLLLSVNEMDEAFWSQSPLDSPVRDMFVVTRIDDDPLGQIVSAALGFLWQLARKNPYATRLVSGASLSWCERLAACSLLHVLQRAVEQQRMVNPRLADNAAFWHRLLGAGLSSEADVRRAAHLSALQTMLTPLPAAASRRFQSAACYSSVPALELRECRNLRSDDST